MILCELLYKLVLFCDIVRVGKNSYCEFDKFEVYKEKVRKEMLEFQRATIDDIDEFMRAKIEAFSDDVRQYGFGPTGYDDYEKEKANIQNYPTYKILFDGKIIGGITCCNAGDYYWLGGIYIMPSYQKLGIGAKSITFIENEFPLSLIHISETTRQAEIS